MLSRSHRLSSAQFERAYANSQSVRHPLVALRAHRRDDESDAVRAAFVVPKKQGKAVVRNRTRRRLREGFRLHARRDELRGCDLIFLSTPATHAATSGELDAAIDEVTRRMKRKFDDNSGQKKRACDERVTSQAGEKPEPNGAQISVFAQTALALIRFYQRFISPALPPSCRFYPSCSRYTYGAIERFGLARGVWLGTHRICRCHPWNAGGVDEVPAQFAPLQSVAARSVEKFKAFFARRRFDSPRN